MKSTDVKNMDNQYKEVPVRVAKEISRIYDKSVVIINAFDPVHKLLHTTTYGKDAYEKVLAAQGGEITARALGADLELTKKYADFRIGWEQKVRKSLKDNVGKLIDGKPVNLSDAEIATILAIIRVDVLGE